jgi:hypothetical protein
MDSSFISNAQCKYGFSCRFKGTTCRFQHPDQPTGNTPPRATEEASSRPCRFGFECRFKGTTCQFQHPDQPTGDLGAGAGGLGGLGGPGSSSRPCKFGYECRFKSTTCRFQHPDQPSYGGYGGGAVAASSYGGGGGAAGGFSSRPCKFGYECRFKGTTCRFQHPDQSASASYYRPYPARYNTGYPMEQAQYQPQQWEGYQ